MGPNTTLAIFLGWLMTKCTAFYNLIPMGTVWAWSHHALKKPIVVSNFITLGDVSVNGGVVVYCCVHSRKLCEGGDRWLGRGLGCEHGGLARLDGCAEAAMVATATMSWWWFDWPLLWLGIGTMTFPEAAMGQEGAMMEGTPGWARKASIFDNRDKGQGGDHRLGVGGGRRRQGGHHLQRRARRCSEDHHRLTR